MSHLQHHTVLLVLLFFLVACAGLTVGLTFAPCYSSMCVEKYFPLQTRIHIGIFYGLVAGVGIFLITRRVFKSFKDLSELYLSDRCIPLANKRLSAGSVLLLIWVTGLTVGSTGYWYPVQNTYWNARGATVDWTEYMFRVTWTGVIGHWCDILIGLVILPVGRHSVLGEALQLHYTTLLFAHKLLGYALCIGGLIHGLLYYSFLAAWVANVRNNAIRREFVPDNPLLTWDEAEVKGPYSWFNLPTGALVGIILIPVMVITSLPVLRCINYNTFYVVHIIFALLAIVLVCLHASTNFYFILPGLLLWLNDWVWRLRNNLGSTIEVELQSAGNDWYRIQLPPSSADSITGSELEKADTFPPGGFSSNPLETYYININKISRWQAHPFTAALAGNNKTGPTLLFKKTPERKTPKKSNKEWTWKLATLADVMNSDPSIPLKARIEGPYSPIVPAMYTAEFVLAVVGGTGVTGALALANWWISQPPSRSSASKQLRLVWTVRDLSTSLLQEMTELRQRIHSRDDIEVRIHCSGKSGRLNPSDEVAEFLRSYSTSGSKFWLYFSGPEGLLLDAETACVQQQKRLRRDDSSESQVELDWYVARFTV